MFTNMKRYTVYWLQALYGKPFDTNWAFLAWCDAVLRVWICFVTAKPREVRIVDNCTGIHKVF